MNIKKTHKMTGVYLPLPTRRLLEAKARRLGRTVSGHLRYIITRDLRKERAA